MPAAIPSDAYVMIIGAMKAGTTSLFELLIQHPAICRPQQLKEPEFFSRQQGRGLSVERYEDLFAFDPARHRLCLEASTGYTKFPWEMDVPHRMKAYGLNPRFIYAVRNPFDRIESDYNWAHLNRKPWARSSILDLFIIQPTLYYTQLREYLNVFPDEERFYIVDFDDLVAQPRALADNLFRWMGLEPVAIEAPEPANVTRSPSAIEEKMKRTPLRRVRKLLPETLRRHLRQFLRQHDASAKRRLTDEERALVHQWLQADMRRFAQHFDFPIEKWGFTQAPQKHGATASRRVE